MFMSLPAKLGRGFQQFVQRLGVVQSHPRCVRRGVVENRDAAPAPLGAGAECQQTRPRWPTDGDTGLEIELVLLVSAPIVELPYAALTRRQRDRLHVPVARMDERDEVGVVLHERQMIVEPRQARPRTHVRRTVE
jgi:hypothetical protein